MQHHESAIARYVSGARNRRGVLAILVTGSVAGGREREDSDVDLVEVVTDDAWRRAVSADAVMFTDDHDIGYPHGYYDVKLAPLEGVRQVAERGDGPARRSYAEARVAYDATGELAGLLERIRASDRPDLPLARALLGQARIHGEYFLREGRRSGDGFLVSHAAVHLALAAGRLALALEGVAYPGPKQLVDAVRSSARGGPLLAGAMLALVADPAPEHAAGVLAIAEDLAGGLLPEARTLSRFVLDNEWAWYTGEPAPEYR